MFQISETLKKVPFFRTLGKDGIDFIVEKLKFKPFEANETICKIGDPGDKMYIIISGQVKVVVSGAESSGETVIATLGGGDYFGEMSLLTGEPRSASVITTEPSEMFILQKNDFDVIVERFPSITLSMGKIMSQRLRKTLQKAAQQGGDNQLAGVKGTLADKSLVDILKFCENNSLNGKVILKNGSRTGEIFFQKGELQNVTLEGKSEDEAALLSEDEAMDELLSWTEGEFIIEPEPLKLEEETKKESQAPTQAPQQLLIINNSMVVQKMLQRMFEKIGYDVYSVETGEKGVNLVRKLQPDVVIVDTKLPDGSGSEVVQAIREASPVPVVLLTEDDNRSGFEERLNGVPQVGFTRSQELSEILHVTQQMAGR